MGYTLDYYIIYVFLLKVTTRLVYNFQKQIDNIDDNKNVDKFGFVASLT
jgi:hypothetical protein